MPSPIRGNNPGNPLIIQPLQGPRMGILAPCAGCICAMRGLHAALLAKSDSGGYIRPACAMVDTIALAQSLTELAVLLRTVLSSEQYAACATFLPALHAAVGVLEQPSLLTDGKLRQRYRLTGRESEVLRLLLLGQSNTRIAHTLSVSKHTARHHTERVLRKVQVHSRAQLSAAIGAARIRLEDVGR